MHLMVHKNKKCCLMSLVSIRKRLTTSWRLAPSTLVAMLCATVYFPLSQPQGIKFSQITFTLHLIQAELRHILS